MQKLDGVKRGQMGRVHGLIEQETANMIKARLIEENLDLVLAGSLRLD